MRFLFIFLLLYVSNVLAITYTPNDDINTSDREFTPTLDCYYQKKENVSEYGYTLQCYDVADNPTTKHYVVTKDLNNTALNSDSEGNNLLSRTSDDNWYINSTDQGIDDFVVEFYYINADYYNDSSYFDQQSIGSFSNDAGTFYYAKSGVFDKAIAHNTNNTFFTARENLLINNAIKKQLIYSNNLNNALLSNSENSLSSLENVRRSLDDTNVRLDSVAGNTLATAINTRDSAYSLSKIASMFDLVDAPSFDFPSISNDNNSVINNYNSEQNTNKDNYLTSLTGIQTQFDDILSTVDNVKQTFEDSLTTIEALQNNDLTIRSGALVNTDINVFGQSVHFDMYNSFAAFKPIGTFIFTFLFFYLILRSSIRILVQGE